MNGSLREGVRSTVLETLRGIAPEVDPGTLANDQPLRDQVDLDSMDWLNFLIGLHRRLQIEIPEADYRQLTTVDRLVDYLADKLENAGVAERADEAGQGSSVPSPKESDTKE